VHRAARCVGKTLAGLHFERSHRWQVDKSVNSAELSQEES
jgi:hypothetical protein